MDSEQHKPGNYLSIDGGPSGLPALYILMEAFSRLQSDLNLGQELEPCRWFNLVSGTGRGAVVALLIGRLRLTPSKALEAYMKLMPTLSVKPTEDKEERKRNTASFEKAFLEVLSNAGFAADSPMLDNNGPKTIVYATNAANVSALYSIRSYHARGTPPPPCTILQAACACVASPDRFMPVLLGDALRRIELVDAMASHANPTKALLREAESVYGHDAEVATVISVGAGKWDVQAVQSDVRGVGLDEALRQGILSCEQVHEELQARLQRSSVYFRFNAGKELDGKAEVILAHTSAYLQENVTNGRLDEALRRIQSRPTGLKLRDINTVAVIEIALKPRPSLVQNFIGRRDILDSMHRTHITDRSAYLTTPAITVLSGLGGSGKTQTALKFALEFETLFPGVPIYFLDASSEKTLRTDLEAIVRSLGNEHRSKSYEDTLRWLARQIKDWLLILDNADNPNFRLFPYIPKCVHGNVVITTRNSNHATLAPNGSHHLEGLSTEDSITLILTASGNEDNEANRAIACKIVEELDHLPLALAQVAGYILVHKCLPTFLGIYRRSRGKLLATTSCELPSDYPSSVATTIQMSLEKLPTEAKNVMTIFAHLDSTSIAHEIILKSAEQEFQRVIYTKQSETNPDTYLHAGALKKMFYTNGEWSEVGFNELVTHCLRYSLLRLTAQGSAKFYSMHILVQAYLRSTSDLIHGYRPSILVVRFLASSGPDPTHEDLAFNRLIAPHVRLIDPEEVTEGGDYYTFGVVLRGTGDIRSSKSYMERCVELWKVSRGEEHIYTLTAMGNLANCYNVEGNGQRALEMYEQLLVIQKRVMVPDDPGILLTMGNIAGFYGRSGRHEEALKLKQKVLEMQIQTLGPEHLHTIYTMHNLALTYRDVGKYKEALELEERVLEMRKTYLGEDHPDTLRSMGNVAEAHWIFGKRQESLELFQRVFEMQMRVLGTEHSDTLNIMRQLLHRFEDLEMHDRMLELLQTAWPAHEKVLGLENQYTMWLRTRFGHYLVPTQMQDVGPLFDPDVDRPAIGIKQTEAKENKKRSSSKNEVSKKAEAVSKGKGSRKAKTKSRPAMEAAATAFADSSSDDEWSEDEVEKSLVIDEVESPVKKGKGKGKAVKGKKR